MFSSKKPKPIILTRKQLKAIPESILLNPAVLARLTQQPKNQ